MRALGRRAEEIDSSVFMRHPLGIMIEGEPWIRSPHTVTADGGLAFFCRTPEGMEVHLLESTNLIGETHQAIARARGRLGGAVAGAIVFNCVLRRLELDADRTHGEFRDAFSGFPAAGFHTYGETGIDHVNQTVTALVFGCPEGQLHVPSTRDVNQTVTALVFG